MADMNGAGGEAPTAYPALIAVFCDRCGAEAEHDYVVHDQMTRSERLGVARSHLARNEDWSCTAAGDFCPKHAASAAPPSLSVRDVRGRFARLCPECEGRGLMNALAACRACNGTGIAPPVLNGKAAGR